jgi:hypothetical protein
VERLSQVGRFAPAVGGRGSVAQRVPILVGITGKRDLKGQDALVRERLAETFAILDREAPDAPKVLLSGMAEGADTIAAELAVARPDWLVAAVLPLPLESYLEDFPDTPPEASAAQRGSKALTPRQTIEKWLAHPKVKTCALPPMRNPRTGRPCTIDELRYRDGEDNTLRMRHYEQLGLWLATASTLLIAVMPQGEQPDKTGGTARVVHYRLTGRPDPIVRGVMRASDAVCPPLQLDTAVLGPVWLIDAPSEQPGSPPPHPFTIRRHDAEEPGDDAPHPFARELSASLTVVRGIDRFALRSGEDSTPLDWGHAPTDAGAAIAAIQHDLDRTQGRHKRYLVWSSYGLALLFWLAVTTYGVVELTGHSSTGFSTFALAAYLVLVVGGGILHETIERNRWQRITEDYRGVAEALRVQRAWWFAGLAEPEDQVDRHYLAGVREPLNQPRQAVRNIIGWARLGAIPAPIAVDWRQVYDPADPESWLQGQINFFERRAAQRKISVVRSQILTWELFFGAQFLALWLFLDIALTKWAPEWMENLARWTSGFARAGCFALTVVAVLWMMRHIRARPAPPSRRPAALAAAVLVLLLGPAFHLFGVAVLGWPEAGRFGILLAVIVVSAAAVSIRFISEKLVWDAEAHRYEDALVLFRRAARDLDAIQGEDVPEEEKRARRQIVVRALGRAALEENEYWLRAHRERPIEQAVG